MVVEGRGAYADVVGWMRAARPARIRPWAFAQRGLWGSFLAGILLLGAIGLVAPSNFGATGGNALRTGWPSWVVAALMAGAALYILQNRSHVLWLARRIREPWSRPLKNDPSFEGAADALAACPSAFHTRFALRWVWAPVLLVAVGVICAFSVAYFVIDAALQRFLVGWQQPLYALGFGLASLFVFRVAAPKLSTWRLASSIHKEVTTGYTG